MFRIVGNSCHCKSSNDSINISSSRLSSIIPLVVMSSSSSSTPCIIVISEVVVVAVSIS